MKTLMRYHVITGRVVEEVASLLSSRADRKKQRGVRRAGSSSEAKIKANERSSTLRLARKLWPAFGGEGTVIVKDLDSDPDRTRLAEYMVGNVHAKLPGSKGWSGSRGMDKPVLSEPEEIGSVDEIQPPSGAVIKEVREVTDEDGIVIGKYLRYVLPVAPKLRGGQIVMPRAAKRGGKRAAAAGGR